MTAPTISTEALRELLEQGAPVTVLDVRPAAERAEWAIPGSVHVDAYDALRRGDPTALADFHPTNGGRVVTVCAAGKTSRLAAERLRARGLDAVSLEGGMRAWSLAWNTAELPCPGSTTQIVQLRRTGKGCLSYLIGSNGDAAVVDASLDPRVYHRMADEHGWRICTVLETHVHADHLSRARALAADTGAKLCLPTTDRVSFEYAPLKDGDIVRVGSAGLRALHTPGHTPESTSYLLDDRALFTGDTLFLAAVGRPDLEASAEQARSRAHVLHAPSSHSSPRRTSDSSRRPSSSPSLSALASSKRSPTSSPGSSPTGSVASRCSSPAGSRGSRCRYSSSGRRAGGGSCSPTSCSVSTKACAGPRP